MDNNDWDLYAVVRSCSAAAAAVSDPFSSFPVPLLVAKEESLEEGKDEIFGFPDLMGTSTSRFELDEICKPFYIKPQQQQQRQPKLVPKPSYPSSSAAASVFPVAATIPYQFQQQPRQPHRSVSQTPRSKRRKNQQKKVVCEVPAVDGVSSDMWAWRKYGQKPIKGSPYPRGYYRCSSSKGCQARKQVERSRADPGMLIITYTAEHNHPVPTHRNSLSGSTRQKFPPPNSASGCGGDGEQLLSPLSHPSSSPLSSPAAAPRLSPTTPLTDSFESELFQPQRPRRSKGYGEEELLTVGDMEMMGEDEMVFLGMEVVDGLTTTAGANKSPATVSVSSTFCEEDGSFEEHFFRPPWLANNNAAAAAGGS